jgi:hypothetical protein
MLGVTYLLYFLTAIGASIATGHGLAAVGLGANIVSFALYIAVSVLFYYLFRPVSRGLSLLAAIFSLAGCAIGTLGLFNITVYDISPLVFFGPYCILLGYLILRSTFLPRALGVLMVLAGAGWFVYLSPLGGHIIAYLEGLGILAEGGLMLWLLIFGVDEKRWREQALAAGV